MFVGFAAKLDRQVFKRDTLLLQGNVLFREYARDRIV
jgi:hypothetical protein